VRVPLAQPTSSSSSRTARTSASSSGTQLERVCLTRGERFLVEGPKLDPKRPCLVR
jgi:hypothetical protein